MFLAAMVLGLVGLVAMALLGFAHGHAGHGHGAHGHSSHGHAHSGHDPSSHGHAHAGHSSTGHSGHAAHGPEVLHWLSFVSPRVLFSLALGFGASGLVADALLPFPAALVVAVLGALALERLVVTPYWNALLGFASVPAETLDDRLHAKVRAVTNFDRSGSGLVRLELDGQVRQVLGTLIAEQRGLEVCVGDALRVEAVDAQGNCTVSKLL
jgi:hypothetical protein